MVVADPGNPFAHVVQQKVACWRVAVRAVSVSSKDPAIKQLWHSVLGMHWRRWDSTLQCSSRSGLAGAGLSSIGREPRKVEPQWIVFSRWVLRSHQAHLPPLGHGMLDSLLLLSWRMKLLPRVTLQPVAHSAWACGGGGQTIMVERASRIRRRPVVLFRHVPTHSAIMSRLEAACADQNDGFEHSSHMRSIIAVTPCFAWTWVDVGPFYSLRVSALVFPLTS